MINTLLYLLAGLLVSTTSLAQPKGWGELTISDGLSQGMIYDIKQDKKGFIWIATKDGLNRYDGYNFTVFTHDPYNEYSLSDNNCSTLLVDSRGWLWVGTLNQGIDLLDTRTQRFYHIDLHNQAANHPENHQIKRLYEDPRHDIWVVTNTDKLFKISLVASLERQLPDSSNLTKLVQISQAPVDKVIGNKPINHLSFRPDGRALAVCSHGLYWFNWLSSKQTGQFRLFRQGAADLAASYGNISKNSWFGTVDNKVFCSLRGKVKTILLPASAAGLKEIDSVTIAIVTDKLLWVLSTDELARQDSLTARNAFATLPANNYTVKYTITNILKDRTGNVWLGTSGYGLRKFNPNVRQFHSSLSNTSLTYLYADLQGRTYVNTGHAYAQLDQPGNRVQPFLQKDVLAIDRDQQYLVQDRRGTFWVSNINYQTHKMSLLKFTSNWQLLKKYPLPANTAFGLYRNYTVEDKAGRLWIGATNGKLLRFDPKTETFQVFSYQSLLPLKGNDIETNFLYFDRAGTLWITTQQGLIRADRPQQTPVFSIYNNSRTDRQSLSNDFVLSLLDDPNEPARFLWVATKGSGLDRLNKQTGQFDHITEAQGLPNKVVYGILADEYRNLWLSTNRGLAQFNPQTRVFKNFTKADGLQDDEFNTASFTRTSAGDLLFGGVNGLTAFRASDVGRGTGQKPFLNVVGLKVNNEVIMAGGMDGILTEGIEYTSRVDLSHIQNLITLEFSVMDYTNSAKNRYRYRLDGIDQRWVEAGTNRFANYAQLPAGDYTFRAIGSPDGQHWSKPVELQIRVHPPFYRTWWAYLLYTIVLAMVVWQLYRFQTQRLLLEQRVAFEQQEAHRLAELDGVKTQFFTSISHEFRTPLTLILGPLADLRQRFPAEAALGLMERNGQRLLNLINQLLDLSKLEAGQLRVKTESGDLAAFLRTLVSPFDALADRRQIRFSFTQDKEACWAEFDRDKLEKIVANLLSNAFKFTPTGNDVQMRVQYPGSTEMLQLTVQDTGVGIAPEHVTHIFERFYQVDDKENVASEGTGIGLAIVHELVKVLNGQIDVASTQGIGTTFTVTLPCLPAEAPVPAINHEVAAYSTDGPEPSILTPVDSTQQVAEDENSLLVIDDNADIRTYVRSIFERDYRILEADNGQVGLELATAELPNVIICDLMMPRLDGFGFCKRLKEQAATSHIPVVMLTAKATIDDRIAGFDLGADDYLTKPFNRTELEARVRNLIQQRRRLLQWYSRDKNEAVGQPGQTTLLTAEQLFLDRLTAIVNQHIDNTAFTVEDLASAVHLSRVQLHRKLKAVANITATQFIREIRLAKAAVLLGAADQSVTQVAYAVGFDNLSYFAKVFQERYRVTPSLYGKSGAPTV